MNGDPPGWKAAEKEEHDEEALDAAVKADLKYKLAYIEEVDTFVPDFLETRA
ncbi:MAG: hypothetical protein JOZ19_16795 [Rubrobacter sp.]|nr:hypothetical protein [Rubrobacter sp.]